MIRLSGWTGPLRKGLRDGSDFFFPARCWGCRNPLGNGGGIQRFPDSLFCASCAGDLHPSPSVSCPYCGQHGVSTPRSCNRCRGRRRGFHRAVSGAAYKGVVRELILKLKFGNQRGMAYPLAQCVLRGLEPVWNEMDFDCLIAVPLHRSRLRARGYNQAELIGRIVSARLRIPMLNGVIFRSRNTLPQGAGGGGSRRRNVAGAFEPVTKSFGSWLRGMTCAEAVRGCRVVLLDDVLSTGATMEECAMTLRRAGAAYVLAATAAT